MDNRKYEIYQVSVYCDTICTILNNHMDMSIVKLYFFAYAINKERFANKNIFSAKNTKDIVSKQISTVNGDFKGYMAALPFIIKAVHILCGAGKMEVINGIAHYNNNYKLVNRNTESKFVFNSIELSKSWSDKRFMKEVLHNV